MHSRRRFLAAALALAFLLTLAACGERQDASSPGVAHAPDSTGPDSTGPDDTASDSTVPAETVPAETVPAETVPEGKLTGSEARATEAPPPPHPWLALETERAVDPTAAPRSSDAARSLVVDYPFDDSVFPPGFVPPTFLWHDDSGADTWFVRFERDGQAVLDEARLIPGPPPPRGEIDPRAIGPTNRLYEPTPYQASARSWTPARATWDALQQAALDTPLRVVFVGVHHGEPTRALSEGGVTIRTSADPVDGTLFYRDVPLMPAIGEKGKIQPLGREFTPLIEWRTKDVTRPGSRLVLTGMTTCANCHSFSQDGSRLGMDVDGPDGDKGTYAIAPIEKTTVIDYDQVMTWSSFPEKPEGHKTLGFLSSLSPDGRYAITTLNESLYVANFTNHELLQVFYPTRGILAVYDTKTREIRALPGADDPAYVHCSPTWSPDGTSIVFARAEAKDPYVVGVPRATYANDPNERQVQYDLVRIPFNDGEGGLAEPIPGASDNGMSNTFPKISPDGRWLVFTKCQNGLLMRPDGKLWIVPARGGTAREMACNLSRMNSWHSFSPNGRWMVWSSKAFTPYTQLFLTHLDDEGHASPAILVPETTASNRAANIPEFMNAPFDAMATIEVPAVRHRRFFVRGTTHLERQEFEEAEAWLRKAVEADPDSTRVHVNLGYALLNRGKRDEAIEHFERAMELSPRDATVLANMAAVHTLLGQYEDAITIGRRALAMDPESAAAMNNIGHALLRLGRAREALAEFEAALAVVPNYWRARRNQGHAYLALGQKAEAAAAFKRVLKLIPGDAESLAGLRAARRR